ncbi:MULTISPECIES: glycosyltransferase family 4 protein [Methylomonas]|uniref:glycosyltransferase family 4 protein n=1 Tax=Methylomonas TaxID=416 RepID=UPI0022B29524|nr:glycosyltransferase family 4 protein [Methylomonas rhizoryzae]
MHSSNNSTRKIRILHLLTSTAGGLGQSVLTLLEQLDASRYELVIAFGPGYPLDQEFQKTGYRVVVLRFERWLKAKNVLGFFDLCRFLRKERFDIIHVHGGNEVGILGRIAAALFSRAHLIYSLHGTPTVDRLALPIRAVIRGFDLVLDRVTDRYIAVSRHIAQRYLDKGIGRGRMTVIHHGIPIYSEEPQGEVKDLRKELGLAGNVKLIGTIGLLEERKGIEYLLQAVPEVVRQLPDCRFLIIGAGPLLDSLRALSESLGVTESVLFLGWRDDAKQLIDSFDVLCHPALSEPFGLVLLEAMVHYKPVVASAVQGIPEVVADGETGILIPSRDPAAISLALLKILNSPDWAAQLGNNGHRRVVEHFSLSHMAQQYEAVYRQLTA